MNRRYVVGAIICLGAITVSAVPALAATWSNNAGEKASVCFTWQDLNAEAQSEAIKSAQAWDLASTSLDVKADNCGPNDHRVPMRPQSHAGTVLGQTKWASSKDKFIDVSITYDTQKIDGFSQSMWGMVVCHEMGHALGLEHSEERDSCMQTGEGATVRGEPGPSDIRQIQALYGGTQKTSPSTAQATVAQQATAQNNLANNQAFVPQRGPVQVGNGTCSCPNCCPTQGTTGSANPTATAQAPVAPVTNGVTSTAGALVPPWARNGAAVAQPSAQVATGQMPVAGNGVVAAGNGSVATGGARQTFAAGFTIDHPTDPQSRQLAQRWRSSIRS